jgi:hypothetical protein
MADQSHQIERTGVILQKGVFLIHFNNKLSVSVVLFVKFIKVINLDGYHIIKILLFYYHDKHTK